MKKSRIASLTVIFSLVSAMTGCAVMSEEECRTADWYEKGYSDGTAGKGSAVLGEYIDACKKYVHVDTGAYNDGRKRGADVFCTDDNAYNLGMSGTGVSDICRVSSNYSGFGEYYRRGKTVRQECSYVRDIDTALSDIEAYLGDRRLGFLNAQLYRNRDYLERYRYDAADYCEYVKENGRSGNFRTKDLSGIMRGIPHPYALENASDAKKMLNESDAALDRIDSRIGDSNRCLDHNDSDSEKYKRCYRQLRCYEREYENVKHHQHRAMERYSSGGRAGSGDMHWINDYKKCEHSY